MTTITLPPGPSLSPGQQSFAWFTRPYPFLASCAREHGDVFTLCLEGFGTHVVFSHPQAHRALFALGPDDVSAGEGNAILRNVLGPRSLFALDGPVHAAERRRIHPHFSKDHVAGHAWMIREQVLAAAATWPVHQSFLLLEALREVAFEIIARLVF